MGRQPLPPEAGARLRVSIAGRLRSYARHPDPLAGAANGVALLVASSQPTYPLYVLWSAGGDWWAACWTFLSTPLFLLVPAVSRRHSPAGRALLPAAGIGNAIVAAKALGEASGVELFLIPCALIAVLGIRRREWLAGLGLLLAVLGAALLHGHYGMPLGEFNARGYAALLRLNAASVGVLCAVILWSFIRPRSSSARPESPPSPPSR